MQQKTIKNTVSISGTGLHSGHYCTLKLTPGTENSGILFYLKGKKCKLFEFNANSVHNTMLATTIGNSSASVSTVEHLMACIHAFHITNIGISIDGPELPILDGSAYNFYNLLIAAEIEEQEKEAELTILEKFEYQKDFNHWIIAAPFFNRNIKQQGLSVRYDWYNPITKNVDVAWFNPSYSNLSDECEFKKFYRAKTFCSYDDIEKLRSMGLIKGGSENNAIVYNSDGVLNKNALYYNRYESLKDFVNHKLIDFIGDIAQLSTNIQGHFHVMNAGHTLNNEFCKEYIKFVSK